MFLSPTFPSRRLQRAASRVFLGALILSLYGVHWAGAQSSPNLSAPLRTALPELDAFRQDLQQYKHLSYSMYVFDANNENDKFIRELTAALYELAHRKPQNAKNIKSTRYVVTRVTAPPGFGKSALLRYLEKILRNPEDPGAPDIEAPFRRALKFEVHFDDHGPPGSQDKCWGQIHAANEEGTLRIRVYDWSGNQRELLWDPSTSHIFDAISIAKRKYDAENDRDTKAKIANDLADDLSREADFEPFDATDRIHSIKLDQLTTQSEIRTTMLAELKNDDGFDAPAFGRLPAFDYDRHASPGIEFLVKAFKPNLSDADFRRSILFIDSLDEIHPDSATSLLRRLDEYMKARIKEDEHELGDDGFLRVFVIGRPEGFQDYFRITQEGVYKTQPIKLVGPGFEGRNLAQRVAVASAARFVIGDEAQERDADIDSMVDRTFRFLDNPKHKWWADTKPLENIAMLNDVIKLANLDQQQRHDPGDYNLKDTLFQSLLARARASHNRPTGQTEAYIRLLEEIACLYSAHTGKWFDVAPNDPVTITMMIDGSPQPLTYLVEKVLNRSGIAELDSPLLNVPRYRFYPEWLHRHLLKRRQVRLAREAQKKNSTPAQSP